MSATTILTAMTLLGLCCLALLILTAAVGPVTERLVYHWHTFEHTGGA